MNKEFIPYEQALELKELGFDEPCFGYFDNTQIKGFLFDTNLKVKTLVFAPTYSQAFRWFRDRHKKHGWIQESYFKGKKLYQYHISTLKTLNIISNIIETYEEAELACLNKLIEIVKNK
jgi:hypothetical protein